jgi:hypothetical protein
LDNRGNCLVRIKAVSGIVFVCVAAIAVAGCKNSNQLFQDNNDGGWFSKPVEVFTKPDWAKSNATTAELGPSGPVGPEELVGADGSCATIGSAVSPATASDQPPGTVVVNAPGTPQVMGGIALGMTECQVVQRAGGPSNVSIGAGASGERAVVLTFLNQPWPGVYRFSDGRLKVVERSPAPPASPKAAVKKKAAKKR